MPEVSLATSAHRISKEHGVRWNNGPSSGAFKRIMTVSHLVFFHSRSPYKIMQYSYLLSVPFIMTYAIGFAIIKYHEGFVAIPLVGGKVFSWPCATFLIVPSPVISKPYTEWAPGPARAIFPLTLMFSLAWGLEMCVPDCLAVNHHSREIV